MQLEPSCQSCAALHVKRSAAVLFALGAVVAGAPAVASAAPGTDRGNDTSSSREQARESKRSEAAASGARSGTRGSQSDSRASGSGNTDDADADVDAGTTDAVDPNADGSAGASPDEAKGAAPRKARTFGTAGADRTPSGRSVADTADEVDEVDGTPVDNRSADTTVDNTAPDSTTPDNTAFHNAGSVDDTSGEEASAEPEPVSSTATPNTTESAVIVPAALPQPAPTPVVRPVNAATVVADILTWAGFGSFAADLPVPAAPLPRIMEMLWVAVRQSQSSWNNQRPTAQPTLTGQDGEVVGAGVDVTGVPPAINDASVGRPDAVTVQMGTDGRISVINGTFTSEQVTDSAAAAKVLNEWASILGAESGFASADLITVHRVVRSSSSGSAVTEEFYRLRESIGGITVVGSEVILVTDGNGTVTGLYNNHDSRLNGLDTSVEGFNGSAAVASAAAHLLGAFGQRPSKAWTARLLKSTTADTELVIFALEDDVAPALAWHVKMRSAADSANLLGASYYVRANGADAGKVIVGTSNVQALTTAGVDLRGVTRTIDVAPGRWLFFFNSHSLVDKTRNISTYATTYSLFGLGGPVTPGSLVTRSLLFGWSAAGISAHANMAVVYDYYATVLARDSFDGNGATVVTSVGYSPRTTLQEYLFGYANAFWSPSAQQFVFGSVGQYEAALDVVAHEFTHGVVSHIVSNGGSVLDYGESGALNEAYSDILGVLIEGKTGSGRWLIGEDSANGAIRSLASPGSVGTGYKTHYVNRYTGTEDDGGEHWNSTIFSHAAYRMITDPNTASVSNDTWARVFYHSLYRLSPGAKFVDGRAAILDTATQFGFTPSELQAIADAFDGVGIVGTSTLVGPDVLVLV